jgi:hypothetical protein
MLYNFTNYGNVIPISGQAKALRLEGGISQTGLLSLIETVSSDKVICFFTLVWILSIPIMFLHIRKEADLLRRIAILSIFLYPVVFYIYYLLASDWPFWLWYYYPIIFAFSFGALLIENFVSRRIPILRRYYTKIIAPAFVLLLATAAVILLRSRPVEFIPNPLHDAAIQIKDFSDQHPGIYAMGDRAGIVGFLLNSPLIQLEGIVGNRDLLSKISSQKNKYETDMQNVGPGLYEGSIIINETGDFSFSAEAMTDGRILGKDNGSFNIGEIDIEMINPVMNYPLLNLLASESGGEFFFPDDYSGFLNSLKELKLNSSKEKVVTSEINLWSDTWMLIIAVLLF